MQWLKAPRGPFGHDNMALGLNTLLHLQLYQYYTCIAFTLVICNFLFTFEKERVYVWKQAKKLPFYIFLVLRYFPLIALIAGFNLRYSIQFPDDSGNRYDVSLSSLDCRLSFFRLSLGPVITVVSGVILMLRVNAVYERDRRVKWLLLVIYLSQIMTTIWAIFDDSPEHGVGLILLREKCPTVNEVTDNNPRGILPLFITTIAFDFVIFILTLRKGLQARTRGTSSTLLQAVVQGGNIYFISLFLVNLTNAILALLTMKDFSHVSNHVFPWIGDFMGNMNYQLAAAITSIIVSNLFMDLRAAAHRSQQVYSGSTRTTRSVGEWVCAPRNDPTSSSGKYTSPTVTSNPSFKGPPNSQKNRISEDFGAELSHWEFASDDDCYPNDWELTSWLRAYP